MAKKKQRFKKNKVKHLLPVTGTLMGAFVFLLCLCGAWFGDMVSNHMLVKALFAECGAVLMLCWWWYRNNKLASFELHFNWPRLFALALFSIGTLSVFWAVNKDFYVFKWLMWLAAAIIFMLALNLKDNQANLSRLAWGLVAGGAVIAVIGILQHLTGFDTPKSAAAPASTFGNRNMASHVIVLTLPFCFYLISQKTTKGIWSWCAAFAASLMFIYVFYTTTRAAWVSLIAGLMFGLLLFVLNRKQLLLACYWNSQKRIALLTATVFALVMCNLGPNGYQPFFKTLTSEVASIGEYASDPGTRRYAIWRSAFDIAKQEPITGYGLGNYFHIKNAEVNAQGKTFENIQTIGIQRAHNDFLELLVELGGVGVVLLFVFGFSLLFCLLKILRNVDDTDVIFYLSLGTALAGSMVNAQFSFPYQVAVPLVLLGLYAGLLVKRAGSLSEPLATFTVRRGIATTALTILIGITTLFVLLVNVQWYQNYKNINQRVVVEARTIEQRRAKREDTGWEKPIMFDGWFYHPEYQTLLKDTAKAYFAIKKYPANLNVLRSIYDYWPNEYEVNGAMARSFTEMRKFEEAKSYLPKMYAMAPPGDYTTDILALVLASATENKQEIENIYVQLSQEPETLLLTHPITLERLHTTAAERLFAEFQSASKSNPKSPQSVPAVQERIADVHRWYTLYRSEYPPNAVMEANEAVVYIEIEKNDKAALPHMNNSILLNPDNPNNARFKTIIDTLK